MQAEYFSQVKRETFQIVSLSYDQKAIDNQWVFKLKENLDGSITHYKVRWVIKSYRHIERRDFDKIYVSVVKLNTFCIMLTIVAMLSYQIRQFDIKTIFLYDWMNEMIYTDQSKNFETRDTNKTCLCYDTMIILLMKHRQSYFIRNEIFHIHFTSLLFSLVFIHVCFIK